ncbi:MAG TPA: alpha/beta fold hydrolase [Candidatus Hydrogenedentes bacterium]|nr:alpha/beta fold hydrolase [Candidatus Hydrogenedentota bacterium]
MIALLIVLILLAAAAVVYWVLLSRAYAQVSRADEVHEVKTSDLWTICLYRYMPENGDGEPVLLCHSALANHFNFALPDENALVDVLTKQGYDCWAIELRGAKSSIPPYGRRRWAATMDDYLLRDLPAAIEYIQKVTRYAKVHCVGHSMGGMLLYAYQVAYGPNQIASAATLGAPPGFEGKGLHNPKILLAFHALCPPVFYYVLRGLTPLLCKVRPKSRFVPVNWDNLHPEIDAGAFFNVLEPAPPTVAKALCSWGTGEEWHMQDGEIDVAAGLKTLRAPLLALFGAADPLIPGSRAESFFKDLPGKDKKYLMLSERNGHAADYNHVDLAFGRESVKDVFEPIVEWIKQHPCLEQVKPADLVEKAEDSMRAVAAEQKGPARKRRAAPKKKAAAKKKPAAKKKTTAKRKPAAKDRANPPE